MRALLSILCLLWGAPVEGPEELEDIRQERKSECRAIVMDASLGGAVAIEPPLKDLPDGLAEAVEAWTAPCGRSKAVGL